MNISNSDILNNNGLWLAQDYILRNTDVSANYLRVAKTRAKKGTGAAWTHEEVANKCYFLYVHLPDKCRNQLPDISTLQAYSTKPVDEIVNVVDDSLYNGYKLFISSYSNYETKKQKALAQAASIIHEAKQYIEIKGISYNKSAFFDKLANEIALQDLKYLPKTWRNLRDKIQEYANGAKINELVNPKNETNKNGAKFINNDAITGWLVELAASQHNYSAAFIFRKIRSMCEQHNISQTPSLRWVSDSIVKPEMQYLISKRFGAGSRFNHKYRAYTPTQSALFAGDCWQIDGTRVNIIDHKGTWIDKDGKKKTGNKFLYIIAIRDVMSGEVLGWEYCYEESAQAVINAIANAVRYTGYLPYELAYDRFPGHNTEDWAWVEHNMRRMGVRMTVTHKAEGKGNIERWFGTLQSVFMMESDLFYGEGVKSTRKAAHRSKEYVTAMRQWASKNSFNFDDACRETDNILNNHSNTPYSAYSRKFASIKQSPAELHKESDKPNVTPISEHEFCYMFGLRKQVSIRNNMIQTQIENATYYYGIDECDLIEKYTGVKLLNCFDYEDLSRVHLYDNEIYLGTYDAITPVQRFGPNKDMRAVGTMKAIDKKNDENRRAKIAAIAEKKTALLQEQEVTSEVGMLQGGQIKKHVYETAETKYLQELWDVDEEAEVVVSALDRL